MCQVKSHYIQILVFILPHKFKAMKEAIFSLNKYNFPIVKLDLSNIQSGNNNFKLNIEPNGIFSKKQRSFLLKFNFTAYCEENIEHPCVEILCVGEFTFKEVNSIEEIPLYFYANSIAILFPYVRAFVSTVTLQANYQPIVLPTMNLSTLSNILKERTCVTE